MTKTVYLHIGSGKTGTTSIQQMLFDHSTTLRENGIIYSVDSGISHSDIIDWSSEMRDKIEASFKSFKNMLQESSADKMIISSENMMGLQRKDIELIKDTFGEEINIKIIAYVRNQIEHIQTHFLQKQKDPVQYPGLNIVDFFAKFKNSFGYEHGLIMDNWESVFGEESIIVRIYDKSALESQNVCIDFARVLNIESLISTFDYFKNDSLIPEMSLLIAIIDAAFFPDLSDNLSEVFLFRKNKIIQPLLQLSKKMKIGADSKQSAKLLDKILEDIKLTFKSADALKDVENIFEETKNNIFNGRKTVLINDELKVTILEYHKESNIKFANTYMDEKQKKIYLKYYNLEPKANKKTIYLHIGYGKTGTTSIQKTLIINREILKNNKILYPETGILHDSGHYALTPIQEYNIDMSDGTKKLYSNLLFEIDQSDCDRIIISSENFCYMKKIFIKYLAQIFADYNVVVVFYVRNQIELIESSFLEWARRRADIDSIEAFFNIHKNSFDFNIRLQPWIECFSIDNIKIRLFDNNIVGDNVVNDFLNLLGVDAKLARLNIYQNASLLPCVVDIALSINKSVTEKDEKEKLINKLTDFSNGFKNFSQKSLINLDLKNEIIKYYTDSNIKFSQLLSNKEKEILLGYFKLDLPIKMQDGFCFCCSQKTTFIAKKNPLRANYLCENCKSVPRERHLMYIIEQILPHWRELYIHESSLAKRGASKKLKKYCKNYLASHYYPDTQEEFLGEFKNIDLQNQNFDNEIFDLVVTQDVFEHIPNPELAVSEIARTLKKGGYFISTIPLINKFKPSLRWAAISDSKLEFLYKPEHQGNSISSKKSTPVFWHYGYDIASNIIKWSGMETIIINNTIPELGIEAELLEIVVCRKLSPAY